MKWRYDGYTTWNLLPDDYVEGTATVGKWLAYVIEAPQGKFNSYARDGWEEYYPTLQEAMDAVVVQVVEQRLNKREK